MSYYYSYYIGYRDSSGKIYPYGPYDAFGKIHPIIERSRSFASDLYEDFYAISEECYSDELKKQLGYKDEDSNEYCITAKYLPFSQIPSGDYIKSGYFLIDNVKNYLKGNYDTEDLFYNMISPTIYAEMLRNELTFGKNVFDGNVEDDIEKEELNKGLNASDYMQFSAPDYCSREYEAFIIRQFVDTFEDWEFFNDKENPHEIVIIETEG